ncbi:hypothetical protein LO763_20170 [Glycomyces sp. A-F 0318]|uniref:hypothetical protein n=1 Tax=Glycomyces amatae TaxID=2881355 RepID=UPI001E5EDCFE|nr:hypothetical protein [Glycomyces amatae]MCD0445931.1 hypothetical protein [Glycomyces amatae]
MTPPATVLATRILTAAAVGAAIGALGATLACHVRYTMLTSLPGVHAVHLRCGRDHHQDCPPDCPPEWTRAFAVLTDDHLELWQYYSLTLRASHRIPYDAVPCDVSGVFLTESDRGPVRIALGSPTDLRHFPGPATTPALAGTRAGRPQ